MYLTLLASLFITSVSGQLTWTTFSSFNQTSDAKAYGQLISAITTIPQQIADVHGTQFIQILDKDGNVYYSKRAPANEQYDVLLVAAPAPAASDESTPNQSTVYIDGATFSTGLMRVEFHGAFGGGGMNVQMRTVGSSHGTCGEFQLEGRGGASSIEMPFSVH